MPLVIPLVCKISYLRVIVSYRAWENDIVHRRVQAAQMYFRILHRWLIDKHHPLILCLRLYRQYVLATVLYGIFAMGITSKGVQQMINMINQYHRIMANSPVHIIRENATIFFDRLQID